jgi:hypothetical protein
MNIGGLPPFSYDELQKNIGGLVYPNGIAPDGMSQEQMFRQGVGQLGAGMLAASNKNPMQALGMSYLEAQNQGLNNARQTMVAKEFKEKTDERKRARDMEDTRRKAARDYLTNWGNLPEGFRKFAEQDPEGAFDLYLKRYQRLGGNTTQDLITGETITAPDEGGNSDVGLTPVPVQMPDGTTTYALPSRAGGKATLLPLEMQSGGQAMGPQGREMDKKLGAERAKITADMPSIMSNYELTKETVQNLLNHPGFESAVGTWQGMVPDSMTGITGGSQTKDFRNLHNQAMGQVFLSAFDSLRGGGQITEAEGQEAKKAKARMDVATDEATYKAALKDFWTAYERGVRKMQDFARGAPPEINVAPGGDGELDRLMQQYLPKPNGGQ